MDVIDDYWASRPDEYRQIVKERILTLSELESREILQAIERGEICSRHGKC